ncbi:hypothetical protein [Macrococcoides canis]|uniref:Short chain dehydrogenase n=1 Tax=Macrococcoides canis TaxID=1855823 RepID=A0A4R6C705_9STAP|nr:hypothetical protein [Macrococcus canis]MEE1107065.1 hypothetical protein [Macrococcus canis]TDM18214.1 hypothetical protein ETI04_01595 [Macrococcus canis]TDM24235.1 hypothetical protein ETI02_00120 [Macrococcus canis]TDM32807.1 hypothetical protein ETI03_03650 [Macrococcus canis]TDM34686.1 hypothetical protein ETI13_02550 [Macrococcus canis]
MTIIIIGGSGMLLDFSKWAAKEYQEQIYLCSRNEEKYKDILKMSHVDFFQFDYRNKQNYTNLLDFIKNEKITKIIAWIHSPYYELFNDFIDQQNIFNSQIYLIKGTSSRNYTFQREINIIKLGKHPRENRWLTNLEISEIVINKLREK